MRLSQSLQWALGVSLVVLLVLVCAATPTQSRFIAKRETLNVDAVGALDAFTADPDIVNASSESSSLVRKPSSELTTPTPTTTTTASTSTEAAKLTETAANASQELSQETVKQQLKSNVSAALREQQQQEPEEQVQLNSEQIAEPHGKELNSDANKTLLKDELNVNELQSTTTTATTAVKPVDLESLQKKTLVTEGENELQSTTTTTEAASDVKPTEQQQRQQTEQVMEITTTTTTTEPSSITTERAASTQRSEDHARSMHYASSTESASFPAPVTPMKLFALPMHTTKPLTATSTSTSTTPPQLLAALLHAGATVAPSASHENAIEEGEGEGEGEQMLHPQPEKRGKFINDNSTNAQQLLLPNAAEVWSLAAMKMIPTTTTTSATTSSTFSNNVEPRQNQTEEQHKEKNLLDWQQIMLMHENHTENSMMSTTLDATEAATQPTTLRLDAAAVGESEMETSASSDVNSNSEESNSNMAITAQEQNAKAKPKDEYEITEVLTAAVNAKPVNETDKPVELTELAKLTDQVTVTTTTTTTETAATAEPELTTTTTSTTTTSTTTAAPTSALNGTPHTNEMAMKATKEEEKEEAHENNENGDKTNDVDSDDVINVSVSVSVPTSETTTTATTTTTTTTLAATERAPITVSTQTAGELSTTTEAELETTPPSTPTPTPSLTLSRTVHAKVDEQLATTTITALINTTTPETVQISNEVNLDTIPVKNVTNNNNENNLLLPGTTTTTTTTTTTIPPPTTTTTIRTTTIRTEEINNSETLQINNNSSENITETGTTTERATTSTFTTTTTTPPTVLLTDAKANSELTEHENSLETNNIGEVISAITTTTTSSTTTAAAATTRTTTEASNAAGAANELEESSVTPTTTTTTAAAAATSRTAIKPGELEEYDEDEDEQQQQQQIDSERVTVNKMADTTTTTTTTSSSTTTTTTPKPTTTTTTEEPLISLLDDSSTTTTTTTTTTTPIPITTTTPPPTTTTTTETPTTRPATTTTTEAAAATEPIYSSTNNNNSNKMLPIGEATTPLTAVESTTPFFMPSPTELDHSASNASGAGSGGTDVNVIIAITVSIVGVIALILLVAFLYLMRKRQKQTSYGQRCRPVSLDAYSLDNVSVLGSVRRKGGRDATRASKRTYDNAAFDDPSLRHNLLSASELGKFVERRSSIFEEFRDVPQIIARADEVPTGCEDKNRYANVIPLPETRVVLQRQGDDDKTEYINANYVRGPRDAPNYYIACQAPLESTTGDFWRMIWEQQSRVIVQATDLNENGIERCAEYLPPSVTLDNHSNYGDYQVTLKHREVKDKYAISTLMLKRVDGDECRELTHYWYKWPETGVPLEEAPIIAMLLEARSSLKSYALEQANELKEKSSTLTLKSLDPAMEDDKKLPAEEAVSTSSGASNEINGNVTNGKVATRSQQGPLTIHCSPGTGRTGTIIACDMAIRSLETPKRSVDIPQLVYYVRRGRASAVQTKEQYEFIYKVANMYATKITNLSNDN